MDDARGGMAQCRRARGAAIGWAVADGTARHDEVEVSERRRPRTRIVTKTKGKAGPTGSRFDPAEFARAWKLARGVVPRGALGAGLRRLSKKRLVVDAFVLVGCGAAKAFKSNWHELMLRAIAIVLSDGKGDDALRRAMKGWESFGKLSSERRARVRREVARGLREDARVDAEKRASASSGKAARSDVGWARHRRRS